MSATINIFHEAVQEAIAKYGITCEALECEESLADTAAFCEHYKFSADQTVNAIIVASKADPIRYVCCLVPANTKLDVNKTVAKLMGVKRCSFASGEQTLELTGMKIGGVTPFGLPEGITIFVDEAIMTNPTVVTGGGNRTSKVLSAPQELLKLPNVEVVQGLGIVRS